VNVVPGEILVCPEALFDLAPVFGIVAGVVAESGSVLDHAATLVREFRLPAVFGVEGATTALSDGERVAVDAANGTVLPLRGESDWEAL